LAKGWKICQQDVVAAYLQAKLQHDNICVTDINEVGEIEHWSLHKALFELKQAGHEWYEVLGGIMAKAGLRDALLMKEYLF
jgi:hypothetical protein